MPCLFTVRVACFLSVNASAVTVFAPTMATLVSDASHWNSWYNYQQYELTGTSLVLKQSSLLWVGHRWPCQPVATFLNMEVLAECVCVWWGCIVPMYCFFVFSQIQFQVMQNEVRTKCFSHFHHDHLNFSDSLTYFMFLFNSQLSGHLPYFPHDIYMVLLENYLVHTSQPFTNSESRVSDCEAVT